MKLNDFISDWSNNYDQELKTTELFQPELTEKWSLNQKKYFSRAFQHIRGHCAEFFWHVGSFTDYVEVKEVILKNIKEEFGYDDEESRYRNSHSTLYNLFMSEFGCDIFDEIGNHSTYLDFAKKFNQDHLKWLASHDSDYKFAAFSAYEKLDNLDYERLYLLAKSLGVTEKKNLLFFDVHRYVEHFDKTSHTLQKIWNKNSEIVKDSFDFIGKHQLIMWRDLSNVIFNLNEPVLN